MRACSHLQGIAGQIAEVASGLGGTGFEVGDMILAMDRQPVEGMDSFMGLVSALAPGRGVSLTALDHRTGNTGNIFVVMR